MFDVRGGIEERGGRLSSPAKLRIFVFFFKSSGAHRYLPSSPPRPSSDRGALVEPPRGDESGWRAGFAPRLELVEPPAAEFSPLTPGGRIGLDPPRLRELQSGTAGPSE